MPSERTESKVNQQKNKEIMEWFDAMIQGILLWVFVFTFLVRLVRVDGHSMDPTLQDGQRLLISSWAYQPQYGDIVVTDQYINYGKPLVKRVIGMEGDTIDIDFGQGVVYRNGEPLDEPYTAEPTWLKETVDFPITVPEGCVFLMGDNRNHSSDSREKSIGCIDARAIMGKKIL